MTGDICTVCGKHAEYRYLGRWHDHPMGIGLPMPDDVVIYRCAEHATQPYLKIALQEPLSLKIMEIDGSVMRQYPVMIFDRVNNATGDLE